MDTCPRNHGLHCILPPYVVDHMAKSADPAVRRLAMDTMQAGAAARAMRSVLATMPAMAAIPSVAGKKERRVYDLQNDGMWALPGKLIREEGEGNVGDPAVNEAYRYAGNVYDFYKKVFARNSLDDLGMALISSVHFGKKHNNAYWNGEQMIYGDGDGQRFVRFTKALDVVAHEFSHGVVTHTCNLVYANESGALNEHFADVMGVLCRQWQNDENAKTADWTVGKDCLGPDVNAVSLRTFLDAKAFEDDPFLGTDQQPKHASGMYTGSDDYGGVHINSGIPNHAFYLTAIELGGKAWTRAGLIWYDTMSMLTKTSDFAEMVDKTLQAATSRYGAGSVEAKAVKAGWKGVGLS
ncbi:MAG TPA: M4 family metallopeptidase [Planctomycetota bacterium]|nr:M4 family metallopeptidase [Planctomycetota bacterium]